MQRKRNGLLEWLEFDLLSGITKLSHGVFLRHGGVSKGKFAHLNLSYHLGDVDHFVDSNLTHALKCLSLQSITYAKQCHGTTIVPLSPNSPKEIAGCDGFLCNTPNIASMIKHADCQAAIFYDPIHHAVANIHCGWRGNVQNIYAKTIETMKKTFYSNPRDLLVCISPSLGPTAAEFLHYKRELPQEFWEFKDSSQHFNFWEISRMQLQKKGILKHHIEIAQICTYSEEKDFFSYRRDSITGRHGTIVALTSV